VLKCLVEGCNYEQPIEEGSGESSDGELSPAVGN
jgi:hypothetical protein